jgi:predicted nucleic acid-binding protein
MIVAAAQEAGCRTLYSEDLQHGQLIDKRLKVINPF